MNVTYFFHADPPFWLMISLDNFHFTRGGVFFQQTVPHIDDYLQTIHASRRIFYARGGLFLFGGVGMEWTVIISVIAAISGIYLGWIGRSRTVKQDIRDETIQDTELKIDVQYIKRGVDDVRVEQLAQRERFDQLSERLTRVEESAKQAHHRLNRLDGGALKQI